jgi:hypothetical protein
MNRKQRKSQKINAKNRMKRWGITEESKITTTFFASSIKNIRRFEDGSYSAADMVREGYELSFKW